MGKKMFRQFGEEMHLEYRIGFLLWSERTCMIGVDFGESLEKKKKKKDFKIRFVQHKNCLVFHINYLFILLVCVSLSLFQQLANQECFCVSGGRDARGRDRHRWPAGGQQWWRESQQTAGIPLWLFVCVCLCMHKSIFSKSNSVQTEREARYHVGLFMSSLLDLFVQFV